uniref:F-box domain-containing protein n=1 Tax=Plectus sambesii TaxID=2011161 RepID=A0A914XLW7_9BILA
DKVDSDSLILVFRSLSFKERVRLELVCKRWCAILRSTFANVKALNVADFLVNSSQNYYQQDSLSFVPTVIGLVSRCGPYVRSIGFGSRWLKVSQPIVDNISHYCTRLSSLDLGCVILNADISEALTAIGPNLVDFSLEETSWIDQEAGDKVHRQFINMKKLVRINLRRAMFDLTRLPDLPANLEYINISGARGLSAATFNQFLMFHPNLTELHVSPFPCGDATTLDIIGNMPKLRLLEIGYIQRFEEDSFDLHALSAISSLQTLHIQNCLPLTTSCFRLMCATLLNLTSLTVISCQRVLNYSPLGECQQLERLNVGQTIQFCDDDLTSIAANRTLSSFTITKCINVTTDGLVHLIRNCPINERLYRYSQCTLSGCPAGWRGPLLWPVVAMRHWAMLVVNNCEDVSDAALVALATSRLPVHTVAMQGCMYISNKGAAALANLEWLTALKELDLSHNRAIDDQAVLAIYAALRDAVARESSTRTADEQKMTIYVHRTGVSPQLEGVVRDLITLSY